MRGNRFVALLGVSLILLPGRLSAAEPDTAAVDEETLKEARLETDGASLLEFFRKRTLGKHEVDRIKELVRRLGDNSFQVREQASADLIGLGMVAEPFLNDASKDPDIEIVRRARDCLRQIHQGNGSSLPVAAARLLARRKPAGAAEVLLAYLPFANNDAVADQVRAALSAVAVRDGKADPALVKALSDPLALKRAAAAEALWEAAADERPALRKLLKDPDLEVRLRIALLLARFKEKEAIPVLIDLVAELPADKVGQAEDPLYRLAEAEAPAVPAGSDEASRRKRRDAWAAWWGAHEARADLTKLEEKTLGYTLVVLLDDNQIVELDRTNRPRWRIDGLQFPLDVQYLPGDRVLVAEHHGDRVTERNLKGEVVWTKEAAKPVAAQRLPNGNTFIASQFELLEVDRTGKEVFTYQVPAGTQVMKAQKLRGGEIACVLGTVGAVGGAEFVRLDTKGNRIGKSFPVQVATSGGRIDVLPNGHVLVPELYANRVVEYDVDGKSTWEVSIQQPIIAVHLPNGHTLITSGMTENHRAVEVDRNGKELWEYHASKRVTRALRR